MLLVSFDTPWKHQKTRCFQGVSKETSGMIWVKCHRETTWLSPEDNLSFNQISTERRALTLSWRKPLSYRNQSSDLLCKSMDWFLYDNGLRHERVKQYYLVFLPLEIQRRLKQTKTYYKPSYSVWKETSHEPLKGAPTEKPILSVCTVDTACFDVFFYSMW